ncbi:MAG: NADH-quinone oxidoreductase subunit L [Nitrospina sp.]|nr:NADH-quinone oxidoreductase subunit L [Nitrospina sp.]MBT3876191.1 NADH-quinone oxidoreductase subunit L [Nitrospina sp.]MBT4047340.1 NADH-quinone oxidoreductase subunit L [Nitrospina sp.]MBT4558687.1 NADH-quinone oxidoreductase subunit L [Nitrospina sp.]MBT5347218.1 NADH-quinone oxidoreductase subunit L [Nitrospina sp.]
MFASSWLILLFPLLGFIGLSWYGNRISRNSVGFVGCGTIGASFFMTLVTLSNLLFLPPEERVGQVQTLYQWVSAGSFKLDLAILVDPLSVFMFLVVTGVGFVIHVYSVGYMHDDPEYSRFFAYLNLFIFSMLVLVAAADFFFLIVGWALVGLASYLLIGFWREKPSAVLAARKAFVMNVIGDVGMVIAALVIFESFGTLSFVDVFAAAPGMFRPNDDTILLITLLLLVGAFAKSAQLPLHTWLPDAMEGPTPVSALIHAATMVTAGVYLVARCHVLYELAPYTMYFIAGVGIITAIFAGSMAMVQYDIKRVIAYSTMSQLGYMFLAMGIGVYSLGMFHLMTHAFFKALLFMAAGSVIHSLDGEQDIRKMGGLQKVMPLTHLTFLIGALALAGFPLTSGYFSKEAIILSSYHAEMGNIVFWAIAVLAAGMTAFYIFRIYLCTFFGELRSPGAHPHESPMIMVVPLLILAALALLGGVLGPWVDSFLAPVFGHVVEHSHDAVLETIALVAGIGGIATAGLLYMVSKDRMDLVKEAMAPIYDLLFHKYYVDEIYDFLIVRPTKAIGAFMEQKVEREGLDFTVDQVGLQVKEVSHVISLWQSGKVRAYALNMIVGVVTILLFVVFM